MTERANQDAITYDFTLFDPYEYLGEYYDTLGEENIFLLDFYMATNN
jgi:hypothetical protein